MLRKINKINLSWFLAAIIIAFLLPVFVKNEFYLHFLASSAIMAITVISFDLLAGYMGYISFGHASFMGIGAYAAALLVSRYEVSFWLALPAAVIFTGFIAYILSIPVFKLRGIYFSIGTMIFLVFSQVFYGVVIRWISLTVGRSALTGIRPPFSTAVFYYFVFISLFLVAVLAARLVSSHFGKAIVSIRENEKLAECSGIATTKLKRLTFTIAGMVAGFAGVLLAYSMSFIVPNTYSFSMSLGFLITGIVGGLGTLVGPAIAAFALNILAQYMAEIQNLRLAIYGLILILSIMFMPEGIMGVIRHASAKAKVKQGIKQGIKQDIKQEGEKHATVRGA